MNHIVETFHALFGFCHDPYAGYGHYHPYSNLFFLFIYISMDNKFIIFYMKS